METIEVTINGFIWWFKNNHIFESKNSQVGIYLYSNHITKSERRQVLNQLKSI